MWTGCYGCGVFVDLYRAVRQGIRASVESYSIKRLEPLYGFEREVDLRDAGTSIVDFETWLELGQGEERSDLLAQIEGYNRDDYVSTAVSGERTPERVAGCKRFTWPSGAAGADTAGRRCISWMKAAAPVQRSAAFRAEPIVRTGRILRCRGETVGAILTVMPSRDAQWIIGTMALDAEPSKRDGSSRPAWRLGLPCTHYSFWTIPARSLWAMR